MQLYQMSYHSIWNDIVRSPTRQLGLVLLDLWGRIDGVNSQDDCTNHRRRTLSNEI